MEGNETAATSALLVPRGAGEFSSQALSAKQRAFSVATQQGHTCAQALKLLNQRGQIEDIVRLVRVKTYPPNTVLCHEGAFESIFYMISSGDVVITKKMNFTMLNP
jgi:hypothetical protein